MPTEQNKRTSKKRYAEIMRDMNLRMDQLIELAMIGAQVKLMEWGGVLKRMEDGSYRYICKEGIFGAQTASEAIDKAFK